MADEIIRSSRIAELGFRVAADLPSRPIVTTSRRDRAWRGNTHDASRVHHEVAGFRTQGALRLPNTSSTLAGCSASRPRPRPTRPARRTASRAPEGHRGGWADVWKRHHFAWEYKGRRADLDAAFGQHRQYALALENPPLLIVSDMRRFRIRTNWTNSVSKELRARPRRPRRRGGPRPAQVGVLRCRAAAAGRNPAIAHRARRGVLRDGRGRPCETGATTRTG